MAVEVFSRYELKFGLNREQYETVLNEVENRMEPDAYSADGKYYTISNIYFDTADDRLASIALRHDGAYRYKVRLRTYDPSLETAFLEIKKKYRGLTNKRRTTIYIDEVGPMLENGIFPKEQTFMNMQVTHELFEVGRLSHLYPKTAISYDRRAYFGGDAFEKNLRITFDSDIRSRRNDLELRHGSAGEPLFKGDFYVMEVKVEHSVPLWVAKLLSANGVRRVKFSKYASEYKKYLMNSRACAAGGTVK